MQSAQSLIIETEQTANARRIVAVDGSVNFRDIGGYETTDGKRVRWGEVYRSGHLDDLTERGKSQLAALNLRTVYDLRAKRERQTASGYLPASIDYRPRPIQAAGRLARLRLIWQALRRRLRLADYMDDVYRRITLEDHAHVIGEVIAAIAQPQNRPLVIHCTAGKDRTGIVMALLLLALNVPPAQVLADYSLSNRYYQTYLAHYRGRFDSSRKMLSDADLYPLLVADPATMRGAIDYLQQRYGSVDAYLCERAGVTPADLVQLRQQLTEAP